MGNQASSVLRDAAEEVIQILKDGGLRDPERHDQISRLLTGKGAAGTTRSRSTGGGGLAPERYAEFVRLGKRLDDYDDLTERGNDGGGGDANDDDGKGDRVDDEMGVAVVFDDSDDEDEDPNRPEGASDIEDGVVIDASSDSEDDSDDENDGNDDMNTNGTQEQRRRQAKGDDNENDDVDDDEEKLVQGGDVGSKKKRRGQERVLSVHEIDAHFLQRQLSRHIDDAAESARVACEVLNVLNISSNTDVRECENNFLSVISDQWIKLYVRLNVEPEIKTF